VKETAADVQQKADLLETRMTSDGSPEEEVEKPESRKRERERGKEKTQTGRDRQRETNHVMRTAVPLSTL
jgi:hypothetical protein